jgi:hypothetical protein
MRFAIRTLARATAIAAFLLAAVVATAWARNGSVGYLITDDRPAHRTVVGLEHGQVVLGRWANDPADWPAANLAEASVQALAPSDDSWWRSRTDEVRARVDTAWLYVGSGGPCAGLIVVPDAVACAALLLVSAALLVGRPASARPDRGSPSRPPRRAPMAAVLLTLSSTIPCAAFAALWLRSYAVTDRLIWFDGRGTGQDDGPGPPFHDTTQFVSSVGGLMIQARHEEWYIRAGSVTGGHIFRWVRTRPEPYPQYAPAATAYPPRVRQWAVMGFGVVSPFRPASDYGFLEETVSVTVPTWAATAATLFPPLLILRRMRRRRRRVARVRDGLCAACGYDLRASSGRCPECGIETPAPAVDNGGARPTPGSARA